MLAATIDGSSVAVACVPRRSGSVMSAPYWAGAASRSAKNTKSNLPRSRMRPMRW